MFGMWALIVPSCLWVVFEIFWLAGFCFWLLYWDLDWISPSELGDRSRCCGACNADLLTFFCCFSDQSIRNWDWFLHRNWEDVHVLRYLTLLINCVVCRIIQTQVSPSELGDRSCSLTSCWLHVNSLTSPSELGLVPSSELGGRSCAAVLNVVY